MSWDAIQAKLFLFLYFKERMIVYLKSFGHRIAEAGLAHGDHFIATVHKSEQLADLVEQYGGQVRAVTLDVSREHVDELVKTED